MNAKTLIRIFALLLFLAAIIAGMAWGVNWQDCPYGAACIGQGECICLDGWKYSTVTEKTCMTVCVDWAELDKTTCECKVKKGHCPHCGNEGIKYGNVPIARNNSVGWIEGVWLFLCPAGHIYWEKE